jgi:aminoglycoside/choline kinase family phosphotransferase
MKPEVSERLFIEELITHSINESAIKKEEITNIERLTGDASTRRYYRVFCESTNYVVCLDNPSEEKNSFVEVQSYLVDKKIRVPKIYDINLAKGYILEEDLGDVTLLQHLAEIENVGTEYNLYKSVIDELLILHTIPAQDIEQSKKFPLKFDYEKLTSEIDFSVKFFFKLFLKNENEEILKELGSHFNSICKRLSNEKMVLTHRDFHSRNIMVKDDDLVMIDFQDARWGIPQYDLASLLDDCYYQIHKDNKEKLLQYYYDNLPQEIHEQGNFENFKSFYQDMAIQRVFKAIGSFSYIYYMRKDERYLKYIGFAMEKLREIMLGDSKYKELRAILFRTYYES